MHKLNTIKVKYRIECIHVYVGFCTLVNLPSDCSNNTAGNVILLVM